MICNDLKEGGFVGVWFYLYMYYIRDNVRMYYREFSEDQCNLVFNLIIFHTRGFRINYEKKKKINYCLCEKKRTDFG